MYLEIHCANCHPSYYPYRYIYIYDLFLSSLPTFSKGDCRLFIFSRHSTHVFTEKCMLILRIKSRGEREREREKQNKENREDNNILMKKLGKLKGSESTVKGTKSNLYHSTLVLGHAH